MDSVSPDQPGADDAEIGELRAELATTRAMLASVEASLRLQGLRGDGLQAGLDQIRSKIGQLERSVSWRMTKPIRYARALAAGRLPSGRTIREVGTRLGEILNEEGVPGLARLLRPAVGHGRPPARPRFSRRDRPARPSGPAAVEPAHVDPYADRHPAPPGLLAPQILIVAELSVPQCAKYRVWQKQELLERLGWHCRVLGWREIDHVTSALQLCTEVIFYRVPAEPAVLALIEEAKRVGLDPWWEVDDLIFDETLYRRNSNLATLEPSLRREVLKGVGLYRAAMLQCRRAIASTATLAACMRAAGIAETIVVENALDRETLEVAAMLRRRDGLPPAGPVTIVYGSGTRTHDADFACAAPAILRLMHRHHGLRLRIVGDLTLPDGFLAVAGRVETLPGTNYRAYLGLLADAEIAIAPLELTLFNDAKSNIKFQEAAILGLPAVCSPAASFAEIVRDDENGLLARTDPEWEVALERLILDPALRRRLGRQALQTVLDRYAPERIAEEQAVRIAGRPPATPGGTRRLRVLTANIFFSPRSFGGATIVAEEMAKRLHATDDVEICVFTSRPDLPGRPRSLLRYDRDGIPVFATSLSSSGDQVVQLDNPTMVESFGHLLDQIRPDVVHAHSIQGFGAAILRLCQQRGIPYVISLHDAWWLCDRQFMVRGDNRYCFQSRIDLRVCQNCLPHARHLDERMRIMISVLDGAAMLLAPSRSHRALYLANGITPERIAVNRNGIRPPAGRRTPRVPGSRIRFGFVGGAEPIKGYQLLRKAFESLAGGPVLSHWELVLVDNTLNLGFRSIDVSAWRVAGQLTVVPAYTQDGLDGFFDGIDVLLFPSQWKESFGLTVREALARNVWVIATEGGGQSEEIEDGVNGRLIPMDGREDGLMEAISELLLAPSRLDSHRNAQAVQLASYDGQAAELLDVLRRAAAARSGSPPHGPG